MMSHVTHRHGVGNSPLQRRGSYSCRVHPGNSRHLHKWHCHSLCLWEWGACTRKVHWWTHAGEMRLTKCVNILLQLAHAHICSTPCDTCQPCSMQHLQREDDANALTWKLLCAVFPSEWRPTQTHTCTIHVVTAPVVKAYHVGRAVCCIEWEQRTSVVCITTFWKWSKDTSPNALAWTYKCRSWVQRVHHNSSMLLVNSSSLLGTLYCQCHLWRFHSV